MRSLLLFLLLLLTGSFSVAAPVDSLRQARAHAASGQEKAALSAAIAREWVSRQAPDSVRLYIDECLKTAEKADPAFFAEQLTAAGNMLFSIGDNDGAIRRNNHYLGLFSKTKGKEWIAGVWYGMGRVALFQGDMHSADSLLNKARQYTAGTPRLYTAICLDIGSVYIAQSRYQEGLQLLTAAVGQADSVQYPDTYAGLLASLGGIYAQIGDKYTALQYYTRVARMTKERNPMSYANVLINMAAAYNDLNMPGKAEQHAREALQIVEQANGNPNALSDVLFTLSEILMQQQKWAAAGSVYNRMDTLAAITGNPLTTALSGLGKAHILYERHQYPQSLQLMQATMPALEQNGALYELVKAYRLLAGNYEQLGDYRNALGAFRKYHAFADSISNEEKVRELTLLQSRFDSEKKEVVYQKERRIRNIVIIALSVIFCLAILLAIFIFKNRQRLHTQKQLELDAQLRKAAHELALSQVQLEDFARNIQEKTQLVEELEQQVLARVSPDNEMILQLQRSTILTEDDWERFRSLFEQVHAGFLNRLKEKYASLSRAEIRFMTLAKLKFSTKEMAGALGVSPQSIRTNWYRIRKKLEIPEEISVEDFVTSI